MKRCMVALMVLFSFTANAAEVCKLASRFGTSSEKGNECTTRAICTDTTIAVKHVEILKIDNVEHGCDLAEAKSIKDLIELGYQLEADSRTLVKH